MSSLSVRLLVSVCVLLLFFFGISIVVLDSAFRKAGEQAQEDILDGHLMAILGAAEAGDSATLVMPLDLQEPRFGSIGSGLYAEIRDLDGRRIWQSRSSLGLEMPFGVMSQDGSRLFRKEVLQDGTPIRTLSIGVQWEFPDGLFRPYVFKVAEDLNSFNAQIAQFRQQLFGWFAAVAAIMLLAIGLLLRGLLRPLRQIESQIGEIESGSRKVLSGKFPTELAGVARNMNVLIDNERGRSERYKHTLDNLAHSLKTPLAAMRALLNQGVSGKMSKRFNEQIDLMDEIVRYQLRKPAAQVSPLLSVVPVRSEIDRLVSGLRKVYHDKGPVIDSEIADSAQFRGDKGDLLEVAGNLLDNACKWCRQRVRLRIGPGEADGELELCVEDDGPGMPAAIAESSLQRGTRLDESTPGHGIGLAVVNDIVSSYGGRLEISESELGGARFSVTLPAA
jgi:two-component system sensor histidine kinase PhoQ